MKRCVKKTICALLLFSPVVLSGWQSISLDDTHSVFKESGNCFLEHALLDYHHYYLSAYHQRRCDIAVSPFYDYLTVIDGNRRNEYAGAFLLAQANFNDTWVRLYTSAGTLKEKISDRAAGTVTESAVSGFDDIVLKIGSDNFANGSDHVGIYFLAGFPVKSPDFLLSVPNTPYAAYDFDLLMRVPGLGIGNYRVGVGLTGGWTLSQDRRAHLTFLSDFQYYYSIPRTMQAQFVPLEDEAGYVESTVQKTAGEIRFTPGHTIEGWGAFHYNYCNINVECGAVLATTFGMRCYEADLKAVRAASLDEIAERRRDLQNLIALYKKQLEQTPGSTEFIRAKIEAEDQLRGLNSPEASSEKDLKINGIETIRFGFQPYLALSYSAAIADIPFTAGAGAAYQLCKTRKEKDPSALQGFNVWGTIEVSF